MKLTQAIIRSIENGITVMIIPDKVEGLTEVQGTIDVEDINEIGGGIFKPLRVGKTGVAYTSISDAINHNTWKILNALKDGK